MCKCCMESLDSSYSVQGWFCEALCMVMAAWDGEMLPLAARGLVGKASCSGWPLKRKAISYHQNELNVSRLHALIWYKRDPLAMVRAVASFTYGLWKRTPQHMFGETCR